MRYSVYGLTLDASPLLSGLTPVPTDVHVDVVLRLVPHADRLHPDHEPHADGEIWYESEWLDELTGTPGLTIHRSVLDGAFTLRYPDGVEFLIDADGRHVVGRYPPDLTLVDVGNRITGPVLGFLLRMRGTVALHASAIQIGDRAVAFVGDARAGKSTIAAMLARKGYRVVTEDVAALIGDEGAPWVCAGCAEVALRPDAVEFLYGSADALPRFSDAWEKRRLNLPDVGASASTPVPIGAVYMLTNTEGIAGAPCVTALSAGTAIVELLANVYGNRLFHSELRLRELDVVHRLVSTVPVKVAATGAEPALIERFCEVLLDDVRSS